MSGVLRGSVENTSEIGGQVLHPAFCGPRPQRNQRPATDRTVRPITKINGERIHFRELAIMAFPKKTEANLAFMARVDPRTVRRWLADDTEPPADVLGIILAEIMRRFHQR